MAGFSVRVAERLWSNLQIGFDLYAFLLKRSSIATSGMIESFFNRRQAIENPKIRIGREKKMFMCVIIIKAIQYDSAL